MVEAIREGMQLAELEVLIKAWDRLVNILSGALVIDDMERKGYGV